MHFSLTDNGGRRTSGDRRMLNIKDAWAGVDRRSGTDRRKTTIDRRSFSFSDFRYERRAMTQFMDSLKDG